MLTPREHEAFQDIAETGLLQTLRAFAKISGRQWCIFPKKFSFYTMEEARAVFPENEPAHMGSNMTLDGDLHAHLLLMFPQESALTLTSFFTTEPNLQKTTAIQSLAVDEVSNILSNTFLNVVANTLRMKLLASVQKSVSGTRRAIVDKVRSDKGMETGQMLVTTLKIESDHMAMSGDFCILFSESSFNKIIALIDASPACTMRRSRIF